VEEEEGVASRVEVTPRVPRRLPYYYIVLLLYAFVAIFGSQMRYNSPPVIYHTLHDRMQSYRKQLSPGGQIAFWTSVETLPRSVIYLCIMIKRPLKDPNSGKYTKPSKTVGNATLHGHPQRHTTTAP